MSQRRLLSGSKIFRQPSFDEENFSSNSFSSSAKSSETSGSISDSVMKPSARVSISDQSFCTALTPKNWQAFAKSTCVMRPLPSTSKLCLQADQRLPYLTTHICLKRSTDLITMSFPWNVARHFSACWRGDAICTTTLPMAATGESGGEEGAPSAPSSSAASPGAPAHTMAMCSVATPISNICRSSHTSDRWPGRASMSWKTLLAILSLISRASQEAENSEKSRRPSLSTSRPSCQALDKHPNFSSIFSRNFTKTLYASGSISAKVAEGRPSVSSSHNFLTFPLNWMCSMTIRNLPKCTDPCHRGSISFRQAAAVDP
mmetsp:Transcript_97893/g.281242  ORF Transcript_97893/g.281242 Transcript_97893/m.281242 type:complete len:317 (+) Transcript_97893:206-1156(+)